MSELEENASKITCDFIRNTVLSKIEVDPYKYDDKWIIEEYSEEWNWFMQGFKKAHNIINNHCFSENMHDNDIENIAEDLISEYEYYTGENKTASIQCAVIAQETVISNVKFIYSSTFDPFIARELRNNMNILKYLHDKQGRK